MKNLTFFSIVFCAIFLLVFSCKKTEDPFKIDDYGYEYFPLTVGKFIEYEVDSMVYSLLTDSLIVESKTYVREEVIDTLFDNLGNTLYKIERFERKDSTAPWQVEKVLTQSINENRAFRTEDNLRFIPLVFPIRENKSWDGNVFIDEFRTISVNGEPIDMFKEWNSHRMRNTEEPDSVGIFNFDETLTVTASNSSDNPLFTRRWTEKYALNIGLVYRELFMLDSQCENCCGGDLVQCQSVPWEDRAEKGFILRQVITGYN
jgi:hypothetical protein